MSYRMLVLPDNSPMPLAALEKIAALVKAGATVVGPPPSGLAHPRQPKLAFKSASRSK
jgi:3-polyprenyl-4-hydroxybenzoate decarboxylase